ncbi:hypothetical protein SAMN04487905_1311, partial [Actinopolyspora xinjiangensis]
MKVMHRIADQGFATEKETGNSSPEKASPLGTTPSETLDKRS